MKDVVMMKDVIESGWFRILKTVFSGSCGEIARDATDKWPGGRL